MSAALPSLLEPCFGDLPPAAAATVMAKRDAIRTRLRRSAEDIIAIGLDLIDLRDLLSHGGFYPFVETELGLSRSSAQRFIGVAEAFAGFAQVGRFEPSALYALATGSTPDDVRDEFLRRAEDGEFVRHRDVRAAINGGVRGKPDPDAPRLIERLVALMLDAYEAPGVRTKLGFGRGVSSRLFAREVESFRTEDRSGVASIVGAFGRACVEAAANWQQAHDGGK